MQQNWRNALSLNSEMAVSKMVDDSDLRCP
jgi:hypothetical protein